MKHTNKGRMFIFLVTQFSMKKNNTKPTPKLLLFSPRATKIYETYPWDMFVRFFFGYHGNLFYKLNDDSK